MLNSDRSSAEAFTGTPHQTTTRDSAAYKCIGKYVSLKRKQSGRVPRPPNAFILFRSETQPKLVEKHKGTGKSSRDFSAMVGQMWREESPETRKRFSEMAAERLAQHRSRYPKY
ncbi:high mobility group box domain-containing protein, partial [Chytriomyces sp. MP71]